MHIVRMAADDVGEFRRVLFRLRGRQVDLVQHGDDLQVVLQRQVQVRERLGLDPLRRVHEQDSTFAGRE